MNLFKPIVSLHQWIAASLQRKLVMAIGVLLVLVSAVFLLVISSFYQNRLMAEHSRASMQINRLLQAALENAMLKRDIPGLENIIDDMGQQADIARVMILNTDFEVRFSSDSKRINTLLANDMTQQALSSQSRQTLFVQSDASGEVLRSVNPVKNQQPCSVCHGDLAENPINGLLVVDYRAGMIRQDARSSGLKLGGVGILVIISVCLAIWFALVRLVITPLSAVEQSTYALAEGRFDKQVEIKGADEISRLGQSFNEMSRRLHESRNRLQDSENFLQALIDAIPDGIRVIDDNFRIIKANQAYCQIVEQSMQQVLQSTCYASSHNRKSQCPHTLICCTVVELCQKGGKGMINQEKFATKSGNTYHVEVSSAPVEMKVDGKRKSCVVEAIRNLDEQAKISQQQRLSEIGLLAAGLAHEIYNPLSSIDLGLTALQSDFAQVQTESSREYFETIRIEIQNCIKITNSLLLLSAPSGEIRNLISLDQLVPEVLSLLRYEADRTNVSIVCDLNDQCRILGSDSDIRMLVINLALNAIHAMPDGGELRVSACRDGGDILLMVKDHGVGIAGEDLNNIFMPFWSRRADASMGRGLGLSIVKAILERNKATIDVESSIGNGSQFSVRFADADKEVQNGHA